MANVYVALVTFKTQREAINWATPPLLLVSGT